MQTGPWTIKQIGVDSNNFWMDKAKIKSDIFHTIQSMQAQEGISMAPEIYNWSTGTSGLGFMEQATRLMHRK